MSDRLQSRGRDDDRGHGYGHDHDESIVGRLERAREHVTDVETRIDEHGEEAVEHAAEAYRTASKLLETYVDKATGTGRSTFAAYVQLEGQFSTLVENLPEDLDRREAFEASFDAIDKRRLNERDFERAEAALEPARVFSDLIEEREEARGELEEARKSASKRLREIETEITERERLLELGDADLEAPVERLRDPIDRYNEAIEEAFTEYLHDESARAVFTMLERSRLYPLVPFERPPEDLREYVLENDAGEYTIPKLLEYAEYSHSKLSHYVDDSGELKRRVATQQTYLEGIDAGPLSIAWPPVSAAELRFRIRELRPLVARVASEAVVATLREVLEVTYDPEYERLRTAATATEQLTADERERLADGRIEAELESVREERERIREVLDEKS